MCILWIRSCKNRAKYYRTYLRYGTFCFLTGILTSHIVASQLISSTMFAQKLWHRSSHSQLQGERASTPLLTCISLFRSLTLLILSRELHFFTPLQWNARCRSILVDGEKSFPQPGHTHRGFSWFSAINVYFHRISDTNHLPTLGFAYLGCQSCALSDSAISYPNRGWRLSPSATAWRTLFGRFVAKIPPRLVDGLPAWRGYARF